MPALAVDTSARTAATTMAATPGGPSVTAATSAIGVSVSSMVERSATPTMMATIRTYSRVVNASDPRIPSGMFRSGFSISSATLATFVTPAYETNTSPVAARSPAGPSRKNPAKLAPLTSVVPLVTNQTIAASMTTTMPTWSRPVSLAPTRLTSTRAAARPSVSGSIHESGTDTSKRRYGTPPTSARPPLNDSENHVPSPATVPSSGPIPRSM